jgi:hypothetical protein
MAGPLTAVVGQIVTEGNLRKGEVRYFCINLIL